MKIFSTAFLAFMLFSLFTHAQAPDFSVSCYNWSCWQTVPVCGSVEVAMLDITAFNGFNETISLSLSGAPAGLSIDPSNSDAIEPPYPDNANGISVDFGPDFTPGSYSYDIVLTSDVTGITRSFGVTTDFRAMCGGPYDNVCSYDDPVQLNGWPDGFWSGTGVIGNEFHPSVAGVGTHTLTFQSYNPSICGGSCSVDITVENCPYYWVGTYSPEWHLPQNWITGINPSMANDLPSSTDDVIIQLVPGNVVPIVLNDPSSPATCANLTIEYGATLIIEAGRAMTVSGDLTNFGYLQIEANATGIGSLITLGSAWTSGSFQVRQYLLGAGGATPNGVFQYVSSPLVFASSATYNAAGTNKLWSANEATQTYTEITDNTTLLERGRGYVARVGANGLFTHGNSTGANHPLNSDGIAIVGLTRTGTSAPNRGYNLVGNPYPSSVNWNTAFKINLEPTIWFRTHGTDLDMTADTYNTAGNIGTNNNGNGAVTNIIPPSQGFWVRVDADGNTGELFFDNTDRSHQAWTSIYKQEEETGTMRLALSDGDVSDEIIIYFNTDAADSFDDFDSHKMWTNGIPQFYTTAGEDSLTINGLTSMAANPIIDLGVKIPTAGDYTLKALSITVTGENVYLEDRYLNIFQDLNEAPIYSFSTAAGNIGDRFALHFGMAVTGIQEANTNSYVYNSDGQLNIILNENQSIGTVEVMDIAGRIVHSSNISTNRTTLAMNMNAGVYLIRVATQKGTDTHRVLFN